MRLLGSKETAARLGITPSRVRQLAISGQLQGRHLGRDWFFHPADIEAFKAIERPKHRPKRKGERLTDRELALKPGFREKLKTHGIDPNSIPLAGEVLLDAIKTTKPSRDR
jgi:hypothetical protein